MTKEIVEMLQILLDNAKVGCADITVIRHVSFDSFKFVIGETIKALEQQPRTKEILEYFKDINFVYNDCTRFDTLKRMLEQERSFDDANKN